MSRYKRLRRPSDVVLRRARLLTFQERVTMVAWLRVLRACRCVGLPPHPKLVIIDQSYDRTVSFLEGMLERGYVLT